MSKKSQEAVEVFRQFAWNLAGTLAVTKPQRKPRTKPAGKA